MKTAKLIEQVSLGRARVETPKGAFVTEAPPPVVDPIVGLNGLVAWIDATVKGLTDAINALAEENANLRAEVRDLAEKRFTRILERDGKIVGMERVTSRDEVMK